MADELQALFERINREAVETAEAESRKILDKARADAQEIRHEASRKAEETLEKARQEAAMALDKGQQSLQQAARDTLLSLRARLQDRLRDAVTACTGEAMTAEQMGALLETLAQAFAEKGGEVDRLDVLLPAETLDEVKPRLLACLGERLRETTDLHPVSHLKSGFQVSFNGEELVYDFSDEALADAFCSFLNPRLAELVRP
jgi:V/A-type H+-transporting ATPase subunit E